MVVLIPNQLVKLYKTETFNERNKRYHQDYRTYCQIVKQEQTTMFQLRVTPEGNDLLTNGEFTSDLSSWVSSTGFWQWSAGQAQSFIPFTGYTDLYQTVSLTTNTQYLAIIDIDQFIGSSGFYLNFHIDSGVSNITKIARSEYGKNPGRVYVYFNSQGYTHHVIKMVPVGDFGDLAYINSVSLYKLTAPVVSLETCEGVAVKTIPILAQGNDVITYAVEWFGLDDDCYRLCITGTEDTDKNYLDEALALDTEGGQPIELEQGGYLKWFG